MNTKLKQNIYYIIPYIKANFYNNFKKKIKKSAIFIDFEINGDILIIR